MYLIAGTYGVLGWIYGLWAAHSEENLRNILVWKRYGVVYGAEIVLHSELSGYPA
jgi:hypothetical protein